MATKESKDDAPVDNRDALEVLESEAKEWEKVRASLVTVYCSVLLLTAPLGCRD
jgi:hypothetical protein